MRLFWLIFFYIPLHALAQTFPVDAASGKIYYAEEVPVKDSPKVDLYHRAKAWFAATGKSKKALQVDDAGNGIVMGRRYSLLPVHDGDTSQTFKLYYTVKIELEDDRYWYSITDFSLQIEHLSNASASEVTQIINQPLEIWLLSGNDRDVKSEKKKGAKSVEEVVFKSILPLIEELKMHML